MTDPNPEDVHRAALDAVEQAALQVESAQALLDTRMAQRRAAILAASELGVSNRRMFMECPSVTSEMMVGRDLKKASAQPDP